MLKVLTLTMAFAGIIGGNLAIPAVRSSTLAKELTTLLGQRGLEAMAAQDPEEPDRFVAALYVPKSQLLVISARYSSPAIVREKLLRKRFRDVYLDLQGAAIPGSGIFFQDMDADGLCTSREHVADVLYDGAGASTVFDADWKKQNVSQETYEERLTNADEKYSRMLGILLAQLKAT